MTLALSLLSRFLWLGLGVSLVWMLRSSVARHEADCRAFASAPPPARSPTWTTPAPDWAPRTSLVARPTVERVAPHGLDEARPGCPRDAIRERTAHHTRVRVPRELASTMLAQQSEAPLRPLQALPESRFGEVVGVRLLRAPAGSALQRLGFEAGDVLETVNGYDLATPEHALEAYSALRASRRFVAVVERRGIPHVVYVTLC